VTQYTTSPLARTFPEASNSIFFLVMPPADILVCMKPDNPMKGANPRIARVRIQLKYNAMPIPTPMLAMAFSTAPRAGPVDYNK